jgi:hypothetical protein
MMKAIELVLCQIADRLQYIPGGWFGVETVGPIRDAAAELRRLSAENAELRARLDAIYSTEPVAWANPYGGYLSDKYIKNFATGREKDKHAIPLIPLPEKS